MKCIIIGSGAREHALAVALKKSPQKPLLGCFGSHRNPGLVSLCEPELFTVGNTNNAEEMKEWILSTGAELVVVGPEAPLSAGIADLLRDAGIPVFGPGKSLARVETSKAFTRELLHKYLPDSSPAYAVVHNLEAARSMLATLGENYVIKADGLKGGKGVKVAGDHLHSHEEALAFCRELLEESGTCVIEEKMIGQEFSLMTLTDGKTCLHFPLVQDHKRVGVGDTGPNTGGMGSYTMPDHSLPFLLPQDVERARFLNEQVVAALLKETGERYRGILYGGFMAEADGVRIVEYNARFGDPEVLNLLSLLESDACDLFFQAASGNLEAGVLNSAPLASVCKYVVPQGYPEQSRKGLPVEIGELPAGCLLYMGSIAEQEPATIPPVYVTEGSRTLGVTALAPTLKEAEALAEQGVAVIRGQLAHRPDIGTESLLTIRIQHMKELRG